MIVHRFIRPVIAYTDRVKMTGNRFIKVCLTFSVRFLYGTITTAFLVIASKYTILIINDRGYQIALFIRVHHTLRIYHSACFRRKLIPYHRQYLFQLLYLLKFHRSSGISLNATFSFASIQIAKELLTQYIKRNDNIIYL